MRFPGKFARMKVLAIAGAALFLTGAPVMAQDAAPAAPAAKEPAEKMAETKRFDDWTVACGQPKGATTKVCQAVQVLSNKENGQRVMQILVGYPAGSTEPVAMFVLPLGHILQLGGKFELDGKEIGTLGAERCIQSGCIAPLPLNKEMLDKFKAGSAGKVSVTIAKDQIMELPISLKGFSAAFAELKKG